MLLESQYSQFKEDLNVTKPKGGTAFITDFDRRDLLAITHGHPQGNSEAVGQGASKAVALAPAPPKKEDELHMLENSDLPKFEDD
jgi:hypothetical protein